MKVILEKLYQHEILSREEAKDVLVQMAGGQYTETEMAALLSAYNMRPLAPEELKGFRDALLELSIGVDVNDFNPIDVCGTGGDGKSTFNISTTTGFIVAGAGYPVAKHGNYAVSSASGSSNVLENLGIRFSNDPDRIKQALDKCHFVYLHAPLFHPAMKNVAPVRKQLKVKTFFNMLGPLVHPGRVKKQFTGVFSLELQRLYDAVLKETHENYCVVYSLDGYDEVSLTSEVKLSTPDGEKVLSPEELKFERISPDAIHGGDTVDQATQIMLNILQNEGTKEQTAVVLANAALAIQTADPRLSYEDALEKAKDSLMTGKAYQVLKTFQQLMN